MPELPEVETVVRTIAPHIVGKRILRARFNSPFVTPGDREALSAALAGREIRDLRRHGKFILAGLDHGVLTIHLGMTGRLLHDEPETPYTHGFFELDSGTLLYDDIRQFGRIEWSPQTPARVADLGPDALSIGSGEFWQLLKGRKTKLKPLLLNQRILAGLGNIYVDEVLFRAGLHPLTPASRLTRKSALAMHEAMIALLQKSIELGGSSISDYVDGEGRRGSFQTLHQVYGREGEPCYVCGEPVQRIVAAQRGTHFCPRCQPARRRSILSE